MEPFRIGAPPMKRKLLTPAQVSRNLKDAIPRAHESDQKRIAKLRQKMAKGLLSATDAIIAILDLSLSLKAPRYLPR